MLCAILRNTWAKSSVLVTPTRKSIRFYRGKVQSFGGNIATGTKKAAVYNIAFDIEFNLISIQVFIF